MTRRKRITFGTGYAAIEKLALEAVLKVRRNVDVAAQHDLIGGSGRYPTIAGRDVCLLKQRNALDNAVDWAVNLLSYLRSMQATVVGLQAASTQPVPFTAPPNGAELVAQAQRPDPLPAVQATSVCRECGRVVNAVAPGSMWWCEPCHRTTLHVAPPSGATCERCGLKYNVDAGGEPITKAAYTCDDCGGAVENDGEAVRP